jgi:TolB-like protein
MVLVFDGDTLDLERRELRRGAALIRLEPQVFDLLAYLVHHRARVVGKDELFAAIWRGRIVSDTALTTRINAVRRAIGDNGKEQRLIRTLRRKGFRFVGEVRDAAETQEAVESEARPVASPSVLTPALADRASVAVLPFTAIGGDLEERWFAEGLVEDVVTALGRFRWLSVVPPIAHLAARGREVDARRIGCELGVRYMVQGAVRRGGRQLRVTARLIEATTGAGLWTGRFDGLLADGFALQDEIASIMAGSIEPSVQSAEARRCSASSILNATPYDLHAQAHPIFSSGRESVLRSLGLLERAVALDPDYGSALADAANCRQLLDVNGWAEDRRLNRRRTVDLARMALRASSDPEPVAISAFVLAYFGEDAEAAVALVDDALRLNPSFAKGWYMSGMARLYAGQPEPAIECFETAIRLNPRDRVGRRSMAGIAFAHFFNRRFDKAVPMLRPVLQEFPLWATPYCVLASCHAHLGFLRESEAIGRRLKAIDTSPVPNAVQFRDARHRELLMPGLRLAGTVGSMV